MDGDKAVATDGYTTLDFAGDPREQSEIEALAVPVSEDPNDGSLRTTDGIDGVRLRLDASSGTRSPTR